MRVKMCKILMNFSYFRIFAYVLILGHIDASATYHHSLPCPEKWEHHGDNCYYIAEDNNKVTWQKAKSECGERHASLLSVTSADENKWVGKMVRLKATSKQDTFWTGLNRPEDTAIPGSDHKPHFIWTDGSLEDPDQFITWTTGEPNNSGNKEYCAQITNSGSFNDNNCEGTFGFICKKKTACFNTTRESCKLCHCLNREVCDAQNGNCTKGCDNDHIGFDCSIPLVITSPVISKTQNDSVWLKWWAWNNTVQNSIAGNRTISYKVEIRNTDGTLVKTMGFTKNSTERGTMTREVYGLTAVTNYTVCIRLNNANCSTEVNFRTKCRDPPAPCDVSVNPLKTDGTIGSVNVNVSWNVCDKLLASCRITRFEIFYRVVDTFEWVTNIPQALYQESSIIKLRANSTYEIQVVSVDVDDNRAANSITKLIEPKECFQRHQERKVAGENACFPCQCQNNETCNRYYGNCSNGCDSEHIGFNCSFAFPESVKPTIVEVKATWAVLSWKRWKQDTNSDRGRINISYTVSFRLVGAHSVTNIPFSPGLGPRIQQQSLRLRITGLTPNKNYTSCVLLDRQDNSPSCRREDEQAFRTICNAPPKPTDVSLKERSRSGDQRTLTLKANLGRGKNKCDIIKNASVNIENANNGATRQEIPSSPGSRIDHVFSVEAIQTFAVRLDVFNEDSVRSSSPTFWVAADGQNQTNQLDAAQILDTFANLQWTPEKTEFERNHYKVVCQSEDPQSMTEAKAAVKPLYPIVFALNDLQSSTDYTCKMEQGPSLTPVKFRTLPGTHSKSAGLFIGVAVGGAIMLIIITIIIIVVIKRRRRSKSEDDTPRYEECIDLETYKLERASLAGSRTSLCSLDEPLYVNEGVVHDIPASDVGAVAVVDLLQHVKNKVNNNTFQTEFKILPYDLQHPHQAARLPENRIRNRYLNICAYDHTRVILKELDEDGSDYINACFVKDYDMMTPYIASQGPVAASVVDMFKMAWQEKCPKIIMLTDFIEAGKVRCERYFRDDKPEVYGNFTVTVTGKTNKPGFNVRTIQIEKGNETREIHHFHFLVWPDHGVPLHPDCLLYLRDVVSSTKSDPHLDGPTVVHCSAGVGRTGTYIAIDNLMNQASKTGEVDFFDCVRRLRDARVKMIQTLNQYIFIHFAVLEGLLLGDTKIMTPNYTETLQKLNTIQDQYGATKLELQFEVLRISLRKDILEINSMDDFAGLDMRPIFLPFSATKQSFILLRSPTQSSRERFLEALRTYDVTLIVTFEETLKNDEVEDSKWECDHPDVSVYGTLRLTEESRENSNGVTTKKMLLNDGSSSRSVLQYTFKTLEAGLPNIPELMQVMERLNSYVSEKTTNVIVHCRNGTTLSGLFCACYTLHQSLQTCPGVVNIYQKTRYIKNTHPGFIENLEQYIYLHNVVRECLGKFSTYSNFQEAA